MDKLAKLKKGTKRHPSSLAADLIGVSRQTLLRWIREGTVPALLPLPGHPGQAGWMKADMMIVREWHEGRITSDEMFSISAKVRGNVAARRKAYFARVVPELAAELGYTFSAGMDPALREEAATAVEALYFKRKHARIAARSGADLL